MSEGSGSGFSPRFIPDWVFYLSFAGCAIKVIRTASKVRRASGHDHRHRIVTEQHTHQPTPRILQHSAVKLNVDTLTQAHKMSSPTRNEPETGVEPHIQVSGDAEQEDTRLEAASMSETASETIVPEPEAKKDESIPAPTPTAKEALETSPAAPDASQSKSTQAPMPTAVEESENSPAEPDASQSTPTPVPTTATETAESTPADRPRELRVFRPSDTPFDPRRLQLPEDFYEATGEDVRASYASLSTTNRSLQDAPLMTKKMRDAEQAKKRSRFRKALLRIRFPDRVELQGTFEPSSTVRDVRKFVRERLRNPGQVSFHLFVVPPKTILKDLDSTLWNNGLVPAALVHFGVDSGPSESSSLLSDATLGLMEDAPAPSAARSSTTAPPVKPESTASSDKWGSSSARAKGKGSSSSQKKPKWFKTGK